jgi:hypothetical protein
MTQSTVTMIPSAVQAPAVIYIPQIHGDSGRKPYIPELQSSDTTKATIVADISSAQHEKVVRVIAIDLANGKSWDASKEIALDVLTAVLADYPEVPRWCRDFVHAHLDLRTVFAAEREAA